MERLSSVPGFFFTSALFDVRIDNVGVDIGGSFGTAFCSGSLPNSTGAPGVITASGSTAATDNDLTLTASQLPAGQFGIFVVARQIGVGVTAPNSGLLCLEGPIGRFNQPGQIVQADANGAFSLMVDLAMIPTPSSFDAAMAGDTFFFQAWHRDGTASNPSSNFTNGVGITFN